MRASSPQGRSWSSIHLFAWAAALSAGAAGVASCADSIHLDPAGTGKDGGVSSSSGGTGGGAAGYCRSNPDCAYPTPVCDTVTGKCQECLSADECAVTKPGTVCSLGACVCPAESGAAAITYCAASAGQAGRCVDTQTSASDCGGCEKACFGSCVGGKCADKWRPVSTFGAPAARSEHVAVWTGAKMFVWGGKTAGGPTNTGGLYDPATDAWTPTSTVNAPSARQGATVVWDDTDKLVLVWGGVGPGNTHLGTGGMYDPTNNTWVSMPTANGPSARAEHTTVWATFTVPFNGAARGMVVWGGTDANGHLGDGAVFDPAAKKWVGNVDPTAVSALAPSARGQHTAVWDTGLNQMIVWGGYGFDTVNMTDDYLSDGAVWEPSFTGTGAAWKTVSSGGPGKRAGHTAVFVADNPASMIVWGGYNGSNYLFDGGQYKSLIWAPLGALVPEERVGHSAVWIAASNQMIIFGGNSTLGVLDTAWSLDSTLVWTQLPTAPAGRTHHTAVAAGSNMIVWGGDAVGDAKHPLNDGAIWDASASP